MGTIADYFAKLETTTIISMLFYLTENLDQYDYAIPFAVKELEKRGKKIPSYIKLPPDTDRIPFL